MGEYGAASYNSHLFHHCKPAPTVTFFIKGPIISPGLGVWVQGNPKGFILKPQNSIHVNNPNNS